MRDDIGSPVSCQVVATGTPKTSGQPITSPTIVPLGATCVHARRALRSPTPGRPGSSLGRLLRWEGFFVGHRVLDDDEVAAYAHRLLHTTPSDVTALAAQELSYYRSSGKTTTRPSLLLHSAIRTTKCFEADVEDLAAGRSPYDMATYMETRSVYLGTATDLTIGRTQPWSEAARLRGVPAVECRQAGVLLSEPSPAGSGR